MLPSEFEMKPGFTEIQVSSVTEIKGSKMFQYKKLTTLSPTTGFATLLWINHFSLQKWTLFFLLMYDFSEIAFMQNQYNWKQNQLHAQNFPLCL